MITTLEDPIMVYPLNEKPKTMPIEADTRLKAKLQEERESTPENNKVHDSVNISGASKQLEALKSTLRDVPEVNEARVLYFKSEIESGRYQIHSDKIALKMLNNVEMA